MITLERKVQVGEDHTILVTLPPDVPIGEVEIVLIVNSEKEQSLNGRRALWDSFGVLADSPNFNEDPVAIQRRMRDEWED